MGHFCAPHCRIDPFDETQSIDSFCVLVKNSILHVFYVYVVCVLARGHPFPGGYSISIYSGLSLYCGRQFGDLVSYVSLDCPAWGD